MLENYFPVLLFLVDRSRGRHRRHRRQRRARAPLRRAEPRPEKLSPFECGFEAFEDARMKFDVRYYLVAILFILFDLEIAFLFPGASCCRTSAGSASWAMMIFLGILVVGFIYEWKKGALEWE
jgi:NADH-quinone oxidoreductase subunit A